MEKEKKIETKESDSYNTDKWLYDMFPNSIWFDPCPLNHNPIHNGLDIEWGTHAFVNPPYSNPLPWVKKAIKEKNKGCKVVLLLKHDSSTEWYRLLHENNARFLMINKRLKHRTGKPAPFPSLLAIL